MDVRRAVQHFEAIKTKIIQGKDGVYLHLVINPEQLPADVMLSWVGTRYIVTMVEVTAQEEPKAPQARIDGEQAVKSAAMLCQDEDFQRWLRHEGLTMDLTEEAAADALRTVLDIRSRSELARNEAARREFFKLRNDFEHYMLRKGG